MPSSRQVGEDAVLGIAAPQRVLASAARDRMHRVRAADRRRAGLGQPEVAHLARAHQLGHRADGLLDRRLRGRRGAGSRGRSSSTPRRCRLASQACAHVVGLAVDAAHRAVAGSRTMPNLVARTTSSRRPRMARPTSSSLRERAVHVGRVEEVDAEVEGAVDGGDRLRLVARRRRTRTCPCSRARGRRPRDPACRACVVSRARVYATGTALATPPASRSAAGPRP